MVQLTCYGGVGQIGGNQFLLEDGDTRLLLDFGQPFGIRGRFYEEYLKPRSSFGLLDPLFMGLVPPIRGLYRPDLEPPAVEVGPPGVPSEPKKDQAGDKVSKLIEPTSAKSTEPDQSGDSQPRRSP